ncbi:MAG: sigma-70 family RNA polymerase sigma factor [Bacteroidaceae bacterium]|nr:sigma-70 family RNA polymerase sigma factor [Bacteroidaceae bacterium]
MDSTEFKKRYLHHHKLLYRISWSLTRNVQDAEDLVQDTYLRLWQKRDILPPESQTEAYLITVVKNLYFDRQRKAQIDIGTDINRISEPIDYDNPEEILVQDNENLQVMKAMDDLPPGERKILSSHILEMKSYSELEKETGLKQNYLRQIVMRAKNKLTDKLKGHENG